MHNRVGSAVHSFLVNLRQNEDSTSKNYEQYYPA